MFLLMNNSYHAYDEYPDCGATVAVSASVANLQALAVELNGSSLEWEVLCDEGLLATRKIVRDPDDDCIEYHSFYTIFPVKQV